MHNSLPNTSWVSDNLCSGYVHFLNSPNHLSLKLLKFVFLYLPLERALLTYNINFLIIKMRDSSAVFLVVLLWRQKETMDEPDRDCTLLSVITHFTLWILYKHLCWTHIIYDPSYMLMFSAQETGLFFCPWDINKLAASSFCQISPANIKSTKIFAIN
jgi:hypothetical protein